MLLQVNINSVSNCYIIVEPKEQVVNRMFIKMIADSSGCSMLR